MTFPPQKWYILSYNNLSELKSKLITNINKNKLSLSAERYPITHLNNSTFIIQNSTLPAKRDFLQAHLTNGLGNPS